MSKPSNPAAHITPAQAARRGYSGPNIPQSNGDSYIVDLYGDRGDNFRYVISRGPGPNPLWVLFRNNQTDFITVQATPAMTLDLQPLWADYGRFNQAGNVNFYARYQDGRRGPDETVTIPPA